ncbi:peptidylprolyl isomerase [Chromohalobacter nigrandesensis]|uniref:peptidylprolyl isomerase n=1 Tax=Chromohalobacter nigrandesensis TaxID=119863 RepID=UPI001FF2CDE6|nr:peptidylprolyl isomerase [Chromohalobacter nigrandesensis]MCK0744416.1 peptidylprolyl isomerase [Chromohalobacter nigrandesensis]
MRLRSFASLGFMLLMVLTPLVALAQPQPLDRIVAVVNKDAIMQSQLEDRIAQVSKQMASRNVPVPDEEDLRRQVLDRMIVEQIQLQMADRANVSIDDTQLNAAVREIAENNDMSLDEFADSLEQDGMSLAAVREQVRREMLLRQVQQSQVASRVNITDREVERYLEQQGGQGGQGGQGEQQTVVTENQVRHILIGTNPNRNDEQAKALAEEVRQRIAEGESFAELAQQYSDDDGSALDGGELGWVRPGQMVPAFEDAMNDMDVGELSQPVRSRFGYHVIELEDRRQKDVTRDAQREQVRQTLFQRKVNDELEAWTQEIRSGAYIDNRLEDGQQ